MVIILDKPISLGDLSTDTFPHCYVTNFYVNGPAVMVQVSYEYGTMQAPTPENPSGWNPCPAFLNKQFQLSGEQLAPFFAATVPAGGNMWDSVEKAIYEQIQIVDPRAAGSLGLGYDDTNSASATSPAPSSPSGTFSGNRATESGQPAEPTPSTTTESTNANNTSTTPAAP